MSENIPLGCNFLSNNEILLDYKNKAIFIGNDIVAMQNETKNVKDNMDKLLFERVIVIEQRELFNEE